MRTSRIWKALVASSLVATAVGVGCGGDDDEGEDSGTGGIVVFGTGGFGTGLTGSGSSSNPGTCEPLEDDNGCVGSAYEGEAASLDIFVMFDLSCSMSCNVNQSGCCIDTTPENEWRIQPVREAMRTFLNDPASAGIGVGLGFFGDHPLNANDTPVVDPAICNVEAHEDLSVPIAPLPDNAGPMMEVLDASLPEGGTPTQLAIAGACNVVARHKGQAPDHKTVILLVTDGIPEWSCGANIDLATEAAADCYDGGAGYQTYVLGVDSNNNGAGRSLDQLDEIALAGGTERGYLADTNDVEGSVLEALNAIRADAAIPCDMRIPKPRSGDVVKFDEIALGICDTTRTVVEAPRVADEESCAGQDGWYYDDNGAPTMIHLCDVTCDTVTVPGSTLFFSIGCVRDIEIPE